MRKFIDGDIVSITCKKNKYYDRFKNETFIVDLTGRSPNISCGHSIEEFVRLLDMQGNRTNYFENVFYQDEISLVEENKITKEDKGLKITREQLSSLREQTKAIRLNVLRKAQEVSNKARLMAKATGKGKNGALILNQERKHLEKVAREATALADAQKIQVENLRIEKIVFNDPATIVFFSDGEKVVVKATDGDKYDKQMGFLMAYFRKTSCLNRSATALFLENIIEEVKIDDIIGNLLDTEE